MSDPIELIYQFNHDAGLVQRGYDDFLESSFQIEEALEGISLSTHGGGLPTIARILNENISYDTPIEPTHKSVSRGIVSAAFCKTATNVERLDKACDAVVFAVGSMTKLGLNVEQIKRALNVVMKANFQKLSMPKDDFGKLMKPDNFVGPEVALQAILDEVSNVSLP